MEYALHSLSSIAQVGCLLRCKDEEYSVYSIARRRGEVHCLLLLSSLQFITRPTPCPPAYDGGRGVGHRLHHKEERRSTLCTPSCASSPPCDGVPNVLLLVLYIANRLRGVRLCAPSQRASPPHNGVRGLLVLDKDVGGHNKKGWLV